jgi:hypothetical protein
MDKETYCIMNDIELQVKDDAGEYVSVSSICKLNGNESTITPEIIQSFEGAFGIDQQSRTPAQWRNLVKTYGLDAVVQQESMTMQEVTSRCTESFGTSLRRSLKKTRH